MTEDGGMTGDRGVAEGGGQEGVAVKKAMKDVVKYVGNYWLKGGNRWRPEDWSVFGMQIRTNNDTEGWHYGLNRRGIAPTIYELFERLAEKDKEVRMDLRATREGLNVRSQKKKQKEREEFVQSQWDLFQRRGVSARKMIRNIGRKTNENWENWANE